MGASAPLLCDSECPVTEDMTYWERRDILGDDSYDYADGVCDHPGDFDYDDPRDYEEWCDWNDTEMVEGYYHPDHLQEDGGFVYFKDAFEPEFDQVVPSVYAASQVVFQPAELPSSPWTKRTRSDPVSILPNFQDRGVPVTVLSVPELRHSVQILDFASDIDPGPGPYF